MVKVKVRFRIKKIKFLIRDVTQSRLYGRHTPNPDPNQSLTVTLKALKHIFQSDVIIIDNEGSLFI